MRDERPTFVSLFAGVGGFDLGLERAGFRCVGQIEIDAACRRVLAIRWPDVERWTDVRAVSSDGIRQRGARLSVDLLCGGFPCQDLSGAGKRAGLAGERSGLFYEIVRIGKILRPTWGLFENVPGLLSSAGGRDMGLVLAGLRECWAAVGYRVLDSRYFGVAQRRRRVFFVCGPDEASVAAVLFERAGGERHPAPGNEAGARIAASLTAGAHRAGVRRAEDDVNLVVDGQNAAVTDGVGTLSSGEAHGTRGFMVAQSMSAKWARRSGGPSGSEHHNLVAHTLKAEGHDASEDGTGRGVPMVIAGQAMAQEEDVADPISANEGKTYTHEGTTFRLHNVMAVPPPDQAIPYRKAQKAHDSDDCERWEEAEVTDALDERDARTANAVVQPAIAFTQRTRGGEGSVEAQEELSYALTNPGEGGRSDERTISHGMAVRRLTPVECERLQGFPDGWTCVCTPLEAWAQDPETAAARCSCSDSPRYRQMGNAVSVPPVEWLGRRLITVINQSGGSAPCRG